MQNLGLLVGDGLSNYIVFDLEWNCPYFAGKKSSKALRFPTEIIEIGAVKLDENFREVSRFSCLVKPKIYKKVHKYVQAVTHIKLSDLENGISFPEAVSEFFFWCGNDATFFAWCNSDILELKRNMKYYGLSTKKLKNFIDVQILFSMGCDDKRIQRSVSYAAEILGIPEGEPFHRAANDASYTAEILKRLDYHTLIKYYKEDYFNIYTNNFKNEKNTEEGYNRFVKTGYKKVSAAHDAIKKAIIDCPKCGNATEAIGGWKGYSNKQKAIVTKCDQHGLIFTKVKVKTMKDRTISTFYNISIADDGQVEQYTAKSEVF